MTDDPRQWERAHREQERQREERERRRHDKREQERLEREERTEGTGTVAENLHEVARRFVDGELVEKGELGHTIMTTEPEYPPAVGEFIAGPSRIVSVQRRPDGRWDIEFVRLVEPESSDS